MPLLDLKPLPQSFYARPTLKVAPDLLGQLLVHKMSGQILIGKITQVEAYVGPKDLASHASRGLTERTNVMFGPPGFWYVYLIYGMYNCLNVVTEHAGFPAAVLIRAVEPIDPKAVKMDGPGKLCREFQINKNFNNSPAFQKPLYVSKGEKISRDQIGRAPRIGVDYAGEYKNKPWRFFLKSYNKILTA